MAAAGAVPKVVFQIARSAASTTVGRGPTDITQVDVLPPGVQTFARAKQEGIENTIDWGPRCDTDTGVLAIPIFPAPECYKPFTGDNGGDLKSAQGTTSQWFFVRVEGVFNIAFGDKLNPLYRDIYGNHLRLERVRIFETPNCWADAIAPIDFVEPKP